MPQQDGFPGLQEQFVPQPIHLSLILDVSPSMKTRWEQTLSGLNEYFDGLRQDQKANDQPYIVTMTTFSEAIKTPFESVELDAIPTFTEKNLSPNGWGTALYDACGPTIGKINTSDPVLVVIVTDGEENSSRKWDETRLSKLIDERSKLGNYTFAYLGVAKEAWGNSAKMGAAVARSVNNMKAQDYGADTYRDLTGHTHAYSASMRSNSVLQSNGNNVAMSVPNFFDVPVPAAEEDTPATDSLVNTEDK